MSFAETIKRCRLASGLSQGDIAKKLGYTSAQFISNWERGLSHPPASTIKKLCKEYGWNYKELAEAAIAEHVAQLRKKFHV